MTNNVIGAANNGVSVQGGPFNVLNFVGDGVTTVAGLNTTLDIRITSSGTSALYNGNPITTANLAFDSFNFVGEGVTVTDAGNGVADIAISSNPTNNVEFRKGPIDTASTQPIGIRFSTTCTLRTITVTITAPYDTGTTIEIQDGSGNTLMPSSMINAQVAGSYQFNNPVNMMFIADPQFVAVVSGNPVNGAGIVDAIYERT